MRLASARAPAGDMWLAGEVGVQLRGSCDRGRRQPFRGRPRPRRLDDWTVSDVLAQSEAVQDQVERLVAARPGRYDVDAITGDVIGEYGFVDVGALPGDRLVGLLARHELDAGAGRQR